MSLPRPAPRIGTRGRSPRRGPPLRPAADAELGPVRLGALVEHGRVGARAPVPWPRQQGRRVPPLARGPLRAVDALGHPGHLLAEVVQATDAARLARAAPEQVAALRAGGGVPHAVLEGPNGALGARVSPGQVGVAVEARAAAAARPVGGGPDLAAARRRALRPNRAGRAHRAREARAGVAVRQCPCHPPAPAPPPLPQAPAPVATLTCCRRLPCGCRPGTARRRRRPSAPPPGCRGTPSRPARPA